MRLNVGAGGLVYGKIPTLVKTRVKSRFLCRFLGFLGILGLWIMYIRLPSEEGGGLKMNSRIDRVVPNSLGMGLYV